MDQTEIEPARRDVAIAEPPALPILHVPLKHPSPMSEPRTLCVGRVTQRTETTDSDVFQL